QRSPRRSAGAPGLNCLVLGGGGREYAIAWRLANCNSVTTIDAVPGNAGLSLFTRVIDQSPDNVSWLAEHALASFVALALVGDDGRVVAPPPARDHKRARAGDTGPNTGGMGAFSPTAVLPDDQAQAVADTVIAPVAAVLAKRGTPYRGVLYAGLMKTADGWK